MLDLTIKAIGLILGFVGGALLGWLIFVIFIAIGEQLAKAIDALFRKI